MISKVQTQSNPMVMWTIRVVALVAFIGGVVFARFLEQEGRRD